MTRFAPRERLLLQFADDGRLHHLRYVLSVGVSKGKVSYTILTPDRNVRDSTLSAPQITAVVKWPDAMGKKLPGLRGREVYLDVHSAQGAFTPQELESYF